MDRNKLEYMLLALLSCVVLVVLWGGITSSGLIPTFFLPSPGAIVLALLHLLQQGFWKDILVSIMRVMIGFGIAAGIAIPCGIAIGLNRRAEALVEPLIDFVRYTPIPAFIPLFILWFGIGEVEKIMVISASVFFQLVLMVANSVADIPKPLFESALTLGATPGQIIRTIVVPYTMPRIVDDLRISLGWAWSGLMIAEIVGSTSGIGYIIIQSQRLLQTAQVMAAILVVGMLGIATDQVCKRLHRLYFPWVGRGDRRA